MPVRVEQINLSTFQTRLNKIETCSDDYIARSVANISVNVLLVKVKVKKKTSFCRIYRRRYSKKRYGKRRYG